MKYVVAVGGTGQHVALALADYLVLAHSLVPQAPEVPKFLLLDADPSGEERAASAWSLTDRQLRFLNQYPDRQTGASQSERRPVLPEGEPGVKTAEQWLTARYGDPETASRILTDEQAEVAVVDGYFGEPRVAAILTDVLLKDVTGLAGEEADPLRRLTAEISQDGARICVVGSAVGGTGAGIIPRLVDYLAQRTQNRGKLCAVIGLPWFRVQNGQGLQTRMQGNYVACLWRYRQTLLGAAYRLVLWGHPRPETATEEINHGGQRQGAKSNLTLPYMAAAAMQSFLVAAQNEPDLADEIVAPVGETRESLTLPRALAFGSVTLGALVDRNQQFIGRLNLLEQYLTAPFDGPVLSGFFGRGRVRELDQLEPGAHARLLGELRATRLAKEDALGRIAVSDRAFMIGQPPRLTGIAALRTWGRQATLASVGADLAGQANVRPDLSSAVMLPPEAVRDGALFGEATVGRTTQVQPQHVDNLTRFAEVRGMRVPDVGGIARVLHECLGRHLYWDVNGRALSDLLLENQQPAMPALLGADGGDTYLAWTQRWFLLLSGLLCGRVSVAPLGKPLQIGTLTIDHDLRYKGEIIGSTQGAFAVLPNLADFWASEDRIADLRRAVGAAQGYLRPWVAAVCQVGLCRPSGTPPRWLELLAKTVGAEAEPLRTSPECSRDRRVQVQWDAGLVVALPAPAWNLLSEPTASLVEELLRAFQIKVEAIEPGKVPEELSKEAKQGWQALTAAVTKVDLLAAASGASWTTVTPAQILWVDLLDPKTSRWLCGDTFIPPLAGKAYRATPPYEQLTIDDVLSDTVAVLGDSETQQELVALPVRGRYSPLLDFRGSSATLAPGGVQARLKLLGRDKVTTRTVGPERVRRIHNTALFAWPRIMSSSDGIHHVLLRGPGTFEFRVVYERVPKGKGADKGKDTQRGEDANQAAIRIAGASRWCRPGAGEFFHTFEAGGGGAGTPGNPCLLELVETRDQQGVSCGVIVLPLTIVAATTNQEFWAVDFGTSSTAVSRQVVRKGQATTGQAVFPEAKSDATCAMSKYRVWRKELVWFPTWHDDGPSSLKSKFVPSQVVRGEGAAQAIPRLGENFVLDHGDELDDGYYPKLISGLKWAAAGTVEAQHRVPFLVAILQQAIALENAAARPVAAEIDATFTLPLRQKDDLQRFVDEIGGTGGVVERIKATTGIRVKPAYEWESLAVAPRQLLPGMMIVVADLGGGTLDLYAKWRPEETGEGRGKLRTGSDRDLDTTALESAYLGGNGLVSMLHSRGALHEPNRHLLQRKLRGLHNEERQQVAFDHRETITAYFDLLHRYIATWVAALRSRWRLADEVPSDLMLVGMGWSLPGSAGATEETAKRLGQITKEELGLGFGFRGWGNMNRRDDEERKIYLSRACSSGSGRSADELRRIAAEGVQVLGLAIRKGARVLPADGLVSDVQPGGLDLIQEEAVRVWPEFARIERFAAANDRLNRIAHPGDPLSGALGSPGHEGLLVSPLTCAAEVALSLISTAEAGR